MKKAIAVIAVITLIFTLSSCGERGGDKSITYPIGASPSTLDPQYAREIGAQIVINNVFEGLVRLDKNGDVIPGIAEKWEVSDDGLTYTFHLQKETEWYCPISLKKEFGDEFYERYSSEKVTADDFVFACQRTVDPYTSSDHAYRLFAIENAAEISKGEKDITTLGVTAPDDYTVVFSLNEAVDDFLVTLTECECMPCNRDFFEKMAGRYGLSSRHILCNGPFYVNSWDSETSMTVKRNKYYAGSQTVVPSSVVFSFDSNYESVKKKLENTTLCAALLTPDMEMPKNVHVEKEVNNTVMGFAFNCSDQYLSNANIRKAICATINRNLFPSEGDDVSVQKGVVPENCMVGEKTYRERIGDQTAKILRSATHAKEYWTQGLEELQEDNLSLTVLCPEWMEGPVKEQVQSWQKVFGTEMSVTVETLPQSEISTAVKSGDYQIAISEVTSDYRNAINFLASFINGGVFNFDTTVYRMIIEKLLGVENDDDLVSGCFTAESYIIDEGIFFPLYSRTSKFVLSDDVEGITILESENTVSFFNARRYD